MKPEGWVAFFGPGGMDPAQADRINAEFANAMKTESMQALLTDNYALAGDLTAAEFREIYLRDMQIWADLAQARGIGQ